MTCKGICVRHKALRPIDGTRYAAGQKRCQICELFIIWESDWCPCCGYRLRTKPRNPQYKGKVRDAMLKRISKPKSNVALSLDMMKEMDAIDTSVIEEPRKIVILNGDGTVTYQETGETVAI